MLFDRYRQKLLDLTTVCRNYCLELEPEAIVRSLQRQLVHI